MFKQPIDLLHDDLEEENQQGAADQIVLQTSKNASVEDDDEDENEKKRQNANRKP
ncbi:MAG TPA: hypothetical protein VK673_05795 [Chthoniobacterales bacterium]|nr:hypothetical protein [Chthoniobacterales bacterium]